MMGCGKTTVAQALEKLYGFECVDTDSLIVQRYGEINKIFENYGEEYFRNLETKITEEVAANYNGAVISLGGGCVLRDINVRNIKSSGKIVYLRTRPQTLIERLEGDSTRPLLKGGVSEKVNSILAVRAPVYERAADYILDTDGVSPEELAKKITELVKI